MSLQYRSHLHSNNLRELLRASLQHDLAVQHTTQGVHRDDMLLTLGGFPIRREGSQGQQKTYLIALKFAQFHFIAQQAKLKPILLLDDIFDKLDFQRVEQLLRLVSNDEFGQIFITDTNRERIARLMATLGIDYQQISIVDGEISSTINNA